MHSGRATPRSSMHEIHGEPSAEPEIDELVGPQLPTPQARSRASSEDAISEPGAPKATLPLPALSQLCAFYTEPNYFSIHTDIQERRRKNLTHLLEFVSEMGLPIKLSEKMPLHPVLDLIPMIFNTYGVAAGPKHWRKIVRKKKQGMPTRVVYVGRIQCTIQGTEDML